MDYTFTLDTCDAAIAQFEMPHEAFGQFLTEELNSLQNIDNVLFHIEQLMQSQLNQWQLIGQNLNLSLDRFEVQIDEGGLHTSQQDQASDNEFEFGFSHYNEESHAGSGLQDFQQALLAWKSFILETS